jgi:preprotein translocase subunit SecA
MQILAPDGSPIDSLEDFAKMRASAPPQQQNLGLNDQPPPPSIPTRAPSTTIDALEKEFQRNKQRDLAAAQQAGGTAVATQRRTGSDVGRNDPCPCGSGKKYKKCHGANE